MTDKQIIINGFNLEYIKELLYNGQRSAITTNIFEAIIEELERKEQSEEKLVKQLQTICDFINNRPETFKGVNGSVDKIITDYAKAKEQECEELKKYLNQIRDEELSHLDIEWDEYETSARQEDYSNIITLVERALGEIDD